MVKTPRVTNGHGVLMPRTESVNKMQMAFESAFIVRWLTKEATMAAE